MPAPHGSRDGFEEFARACQQRLYRTAYLLCGNAETARDLTQTTLAKLFQHWRRASAAEYPEAYAKTVLTRTFLAGRRRRLRDLVAYAKAGGPGPHAAEPSDLRVTLLAALAELRPGHARRSCCATGRICGSPYARRGRSRSRSAGTSRPRA